MCPSFEKEEDVLTATKTVYESTKCFRPSQFHKGKYQEYNLNGIVKFTQGQVMQQTVETQKNLMKHVNLDQLEDIRDQME